MIVLFLLLAALCSAAEKTGPAAGTRIPDFEAVDQNGNRQTFASLKGPRGLMLLFSRSADWCPFCKGQLLDLNHHSQGGLGLVSMRERAILIGANLKIISSPGEGCAFELSLPLSE